MGGYGQIAGLVAGDEPLPFTASLQLVTPQWQVLAAQSDTCGTLTTTWDEQERWRSAGTLMSPELFAPTPLARYSMATVPSSARPASSRARGVRVEVAVEALETLSLEGVYLYMRVPVDAFAGGTAGVTGADGESSVAELPGELPENRHLLRAMEGVGVTLRSLDGARRLEIASARPCLMALQDDRAYGLTDYTLLVRLHAGVLEKGQRTELGLLLTPSVRPDRTPVELSVKRRSNLGPFDGFGGNYCFGTRTPVAEHTLATLTQAWVRTDMTLRDWEPVNDNRNPAVADWGAYRARDQAGSELRHEFELARRLALPGRRWIASVWNLPGWMYLEDVGPWTPGSIVRAGLWPEMIESIVTYLLYQKRQYGVEPDLFSFNEPGAGIHVRFTQREHAQLIHDLDLAFREAGLRTRLLLGDVAKTSSLAYAEEAADALDSHTAVGAVAFHTWNGGTPESFRAWREFADRVERPLLVTELGLEPSAWQTHAYRTFHYGVRELALLFDVMTFARPEGILYWQFSNDYPLCRPDADGILQPTSRYVDWLQLCNQTPRGSVYLATQSSLPEVRIVAFGDGRSTIQAIHIFNPTGWRDAVLSGLPRGRQRWVLRIPDRQRRSYVYHRVSGNPRSGELAFPLPARSLLTLTPAVAP